MEIAIDFPIVIILIIAFSISAYILGSIKGLSRKMRKEAKAVQDAISHFRRVAEKTNLYLIRLNLVVREIEEKAGKDTQK